MPGNMSSVDYKFYQSQFGVTDEELCYFNGILIGIVIHKENDSLFSKETTIYISLLPKLNSSRSYDWPTLDEFKRALHSLLSGISTWQLRCEYDCDQYPVEIIKNDVKKLLSEFDKVIDYCLGEGRECPNFVADKTLG
jgi:hypothetical protein